MAEAIAGARSHVHIAGWCVTPDFALTADEPPVILHDLLADAARRVPVRVLLWGGAPLPMYPVSRRAVRQNARRALQGQRRRVRARHARAPAALPPREARDRRRRAGLRRRHRPHGLRRQPARPTEASTQGKPRLARRRHRPPRVRRSQPSAVISACAGTKPRTSGCHHRTSLAAAGDQELQIVRTVPERIYKALPRGEFSILASYAGALRSAAAPRLSGEPVPVVGRDRGDPQGEAARLRRATASACCSCCPRSPTRAPTTPPVSSACSPTRTTAPAGCSPAPATPSPTEHPIASTCTPRWESSTIAGSRWDPPT